MKIFHEMKHLPSVMGAALYAYERMLKPDGWVLDSLYGGYNSQYIAKPGDPRQFHFRWRGKDEVEVWSAVRKGRLLLVMRDAMDVARLLVIVQRPKATPKIP